MRLQEVAGVVLSACIALNGCNSTERDSINFNERVESINNPNLDTINDFFSRTHLIFTFQEILTPLLDSNKQVDSCTEYNDLVRALYLAAIKLKNQTFRNFVEQHTTNSPIQVQYEVREEIGSTLDTVHLTPDNTRPALQQELENLTLICDLLESFLQIKVGPEGQITRDQLSPIRLQYLNYPR